MTPIRAGDGRALTSRTLIFTPEFKRGEEVYLKSDPEQLKHIVVGFQITDDIQYIIRGIDLEHTVYPFELSKTPEQV